MEDLSVDGSIILNVSYGSMMGGHGLWLCVSKIGTSGVLL